MWWVAFTMLCACGRVHFDERSDARDVIADASGFAPTTVDYLKAPNAAAGDRFGGPVVLAADGRTLAVAAQLEASAATGINGDAANSRHHYGQLLAQKIVPTHEEMSKKMNASAFSCGDRGVVEQPFGYA